MHRLLLLPLALVLMLAGSAFALDGTKGVCGIPWGTQPTELSGFTRLSTTPLLEFHKAPPELELIEDVRASEALFGFSEKGLYVVFFHPETADGYNTAMDQIMADYGNPRIKIEGDYKVYAWLEGDLKIKIKNNTVTGERKLAFYNQRMVPEERRAIFEEHADTGSGFFPSTKGGQPAQAPLLKF
ncbi:MAG: hypothetical protein KKE73_02715 [Proteobacteria bacterium]|nr:hypothetical protein [Pseudomonadota bacterium]